MLDRFVRRFDRERFWVDIEQARNQRRSDDPIQEYIRDRGLRFLVQTKTVISIGRIRENLLEAWGAPPDESSPRIERLFQVGGEEAGEEHLAVFNLVTVENVAVQSLGHNPYDACYALMLSRDVESVQPDLPYMGHFDPWARAGGAKAPVPPPDKAWALRNMRVDEAWRLTPPGNGQMFGAGVRIAHLDTGWTDHDDLDKANFATSGIRDFIRGNGDGSDPMHGIPGLNPGHGTRTGSVMMSQGGISTSDTTGPGAITGVAPRATYVPKRCIRSVVVIFAGDIATAVWHSTTTDCHVISMSLGGRPASALRVAIQDAVAKHLVVVAAAGNKTPGQMVVWPAAYPECIALAATNEKSAPWCPSSKGSAVDVSAPGDNVWVAEPTDPPIGISVGSGTSYATAHTAGVAALWLAFFDRAELLKSLRPAVYLQEVFRRHLKQTARVPGGWDAAKYGAGIVDVKALLDSTPSLAVPLGFGEGKQLFDLPFHLRRRLKWKLMLAEAQDQTALLSVFQHELSNLALDHGDSELRDGRPSGILRAMPKVSETMRRWLQE